MSVGEPNTVVGPQGGAKERSGDQAAAAELGYDPGWTDATWRGAQPVEPPEAGLGRKIAGALRVALFVLATLALLPVFFAARALGGRLDRAVAGWWCGAGARCVGLRVRRVGAPSPKGGALLVNHASWLDILVVGSSAPVHFVAKAEISGWPIFGWIGRISRTVFIARRRSEAKAQERMLARRAESGELLCLFAEGTSSDGQRVLPFKTALFSMFYDEGGAPRGIAAQPVSIHYAPPPGLAPSFFGWWGRMPLFPHIRNVLRHGPGGVATITFHPPLDPADFANRKRLAAEAERVVRAGRDAAAEGAV
ncbi:MAG: lysophospholipid acyltransferase family protein [Pseudomonadota bacterium]